MNLRTIAIAALVTLLVTAGAAAAAPGNAPTDAGAEQSDADGAAAADAGGPPVDLPEQVPDHVSEIHDRIWAFLADDLAGSLGEAVSDVTPGGDAEASGSSNDSTTADGADS